MGWVMLYQPILRGSVYNGVQSPYCTVCTVSRPAQKYSKSCSITNSSFPASQLSHFNFFYLFDALFPWIGGNVQC